MRTMKHYRLSAAASVRDIQARNKKEAIEAFKKQVAPFISKNDKITFLK